MPTVTVTLCDRWTAHRYLFTEFQRITLAAGIWSVLKLCTRTRSTHGRCWSATAEAWWCCGIWTGGVPSNTFSAHRYHILQCWYLSSEHQNKACNGLFLCPLQQLESVWWMEDGANILSSHSDGSYCQWTVTGEDPQTEPEKQETPYGETTLPKWLVFGCSCKHVP